MAFGITTGIGAPSYFRGLFSYLRRSGFDVVFIAKDEAGAREFALSEGAEFIPISLKREPNPIADLMGLISMIRILRNARPDVAVWGTPKAGLLGVLASRLLGVKSVYVVHGLRYAGETGWRRRLLRTLEAVSCRGAGDALCVGHEIADQLVRDKVTSRRPKVIGNGSANGIESVSPVPRAKATSILGLPAEAKIVGFVGRVTSDKGIGELLAAWDLVAAEYDGPVILVVAGSREMDSFEEPLASAIQGAKGVCWLGHVADLGAFYSAMDVLVLPSKREGLPAVLLEAGAYGIPSVVGTNPGVGEAIEDGVTGLKVVPSDSHALASAMLWLLREDFARSKMGEAAQAHVLAKYSRSDVHLAWREYLLSLV